ncbi:hypothetical protein GCM10009861_19540 [Neomicrococcus aestuarii]
MSFFPLITDENALREIDEWMATRVWLAMRKRTELLKTPETKLPQPHNMEKSKLIGFQTTSTRTGDIIDLRMPSVRKIAKVMKMAISTHGLHVVSGQAPLYLYSQE